MAPPRWLLVGFVGLAGLSASLAAGEPVPTGRQVDPLPRGARTRLGSLRLRFNWPLAGTAFAPNGKALAVALSKGDRGSLRLLEMPGGREVWRRAEGGDLDQIAFTPDGKFLAGIADGPDGAAVRLWDAATGGRAGILVQGVGGIGCLAFSRDGRTLAVGTRKGRILLLDRAAGRVVRRLDGRGEWVGQLVFTPDGKRLVSAGWFFAPDRGGNAVRRGRYCRWDLTTGRLTREVQGPAEAALAPDGKTLATADGDDAIRVWDLGTGRTRCRLPAKPFPFVFSADGKTLATSAGGGQPIRLWDAGSGKELRPFPGQARGEVVIALSPDGRYLVSRDQTQPPGWALRIREVATGKEMRPAEGHRGAVTALAFSPDGARLVSGGAGGTVLLWATATGKVLGRFTRHAGEVTAVALAPDGRTVASGDAEGTVYLWDGITGKVVRRFDNPRRGRFGEPYCAGVLAFSPDGKRLVVLSQAGQYGLRKDSEVRLWEAGTGKEVRKYSVAGCLLAVSPDLRRAAGYEVPDRVTEVFALWDLATGKPLWRSKAKDFWDFSRVAFSPDGKTLAASMLQFGDVLHGFVGHDVGLWETATGRVIHRMENGVGTTDVGPGSWAFPVAFSADGRTLFAEGMPRADQPRGLQGMLRAWDVATGKAVGRFAAHRGRIPCLAVAPQGGLLASGGVDGTILVRDPARLALRRPWPRAAPTRR